MTEFEARIIQPTQTNGFDGPCCAMPTLSDLLLSHYSDRFRRIWVARSRLNSVCITVFPMNPNLTYRFVIRERISCPLDFDYCVRIMDETLGNWNSN